MKFTLKFLIFFAAIGSYSLLGPLPYIGSVTEIGIIEGPDLNVPYQYHFGLLKYATSQNYYESFRIVERS